MTQMARRGCGHTKFSVEVTDKDGFGMTRDVFVFVDGTCN